jgi:hypothetical protein
MIRAVVVQNPVVREPGRFCRSRGRAGRAGRAAAGFCRAGSHTERERRAHQINDERHTLMRYLAGESLLIYLSAPWLIVNYGA